jgi:hypothetical protein
MSNGASMYSAAHESFENPEPGARNVADLIMHMCQIDKTGLGSVRLAMLRRIELSFIPTILN